MQRYRQVLVYGIAVTAAIGIGLRASRSPAQSPPGGGSWGVASADLAAEQIEFRVEDKHDSHSGHVWVVGHVKNIKGGKFQGAATARLYELTAGQSKAVVQVKVPPLDPGQGTQLAYHRTWDTMGKSPPDYKLEILVDPDSRDDRGNNVKVRSGKEINALFVNVTPALKNPLTVVGLVPKAVDGKFGKAATAPGGANAAQSSGGKQPQKNLNPLPKESAKANLSKTQANLQPQGGNRLPPQKNALPPASPAGTGTQFPATKLHPLDLPQPNFVRPVTPSAKLPPVPKLPNSTNADTAPYADLVCWVESAGYKDPSSGQQQDGVHFLDVGRVRVIVQNSTISPANGCKVGIVKRQAAKGSMQLKKLPSMSLVKPSMSKAKFPPLQAAGGQATPWLATADVPPLKGMETATVWITLPAGERAAIGEGLSQSYYQVMVDMQGDVKEGDTIHSVGETNNWSNGFYVKEGPYIEDFEVQNSSLMPGEKLRFWARVHGSSRWGIQYEYPSSTLPTQLFDKDPVQHKPFPVYNKGTYITLPWLPWPPGGPQLQAAKMNVTLIAWNSNDSRKASRQLNLSLDDFDGQFQIVDATCSYNQATKKVDHVTVLLSANCNKDMKIGPFGDPEHGSLYVKCTILNPKRIVLVDECPDCNIKTIAHYVEGETVSQGSYCADPDTAKVNNNLPLTVYPDADKKSAWPQPWTSGPLPGKEVLGLKLLPVCSKPVVGMTSGKKNAGVFQPGGLVQDHKPEIRIEVVVHTMKQTIKLKKTMSVAAAPTTWGVGTDKTEEDGPAADLSRFLGLGQW